MRRMRKKIITGILITTMAFMTVGCGRQTEPADTTEDITAKVSTEADKEVIAEPVTISIEQESFNVAFYLEAGESKSLVVDTDYEGKLEYRSSNDSVATIDENGKVTAIKNGTATMTVIAGESKRTVNVIVRTLVAEEEMEEETDSTEQPKNVSNESETTANTTANTTEKANQSDSTTANAGEGDTTTEESNPGYNPEDYYLDWYYIQDQVNARLKANYPNCTIGRQSDNWGGGDSIDGIEGSGWTNEVKINDFYNFITNPICGRSQLDVNTTATIGVFIDSITVEQDGTRIITYTFYFGS